MLTILDWSLNDLIILVLKFINQGTQGCQDLGHLAQNNKKPLSHEPNGFLKIAKDRFGF